MKQFQQRTVRIRTKNPSSNPLRKAILVPFLAVCRLGSRTPTKEVFPRAMHKVFECNSVESVENSRDKLRMKECFRRANVTQAEMYNGSFRNIEDIKRHFKISVGEGYQLVGKAICGFQGHGMVLINNDIELSNFCRTHTPQNYFIELFYNFGREYRFHATRSEVFLTWRKLRSKDAEERWFFNSHNCNWVGEGNQLFNKPSNWKQLCDEACRAVAATGLDIGAVDIRVSSQDTRQFIVCEVNSAPALGEDGIDAYREQIRKVLINKYNNEK
jgi:glutathione synthase/RimK-type ligase-like ATP-grasp enzyme